ncbi:hypothetical protein ABIF63_006124 [Bradyrhizobium japonicum]|uniref:Uncharacterized protein n=1 Tax=Bradyrhizobium japonicum TaxID=375 RepID=A0ABV2RYJ6_BRAJP
MADIAGLTTADRAGEYAGRKTGKARSSRLGLETRALVAALNEMAESFGSSFTVVQVTADDTTTQIWVALAKPSQALTLVLAAVPEGWTAEVLSVALTPNQQRMFEELKLQPGDVYRLTNPK